MRLAHGIGRQKDHAATSSSGLCGPTSSLNKANGDEFRVNRPHVAAGLVYFVGDLAWIHSQFMDAGCLRNSSTEGELAVKGQGRDT